MVVMFWHTKLKEKNTKLMFKTHKIQKSKILEQKYKKFYLRNKSADLPILGSKTHKKLHVVIITNNYFKFSFKSKFL